MVGCSAYYQVVAHCLVDPNDLDKDKQTIEIYQAGVRHFTTVAASLVPAATVLAKHVLALEQMMDETDHNCINISILLVKHMKTCQQVQAATN